MNTEPRAPDTCKQLWRDGDGQLRCTLFIGGGNVEVQALPEDFALPLGFFAEDGRQIADPTDAWAAEAVTAT